MSDVTDRLDALFREVYGPVIADAIDEPTIGDYETPAEWLRAYAAWKRRTSQAFAEADAEVARMACEALGRERR